MSEIPPSREVLREQLLRMCERVSEAHRPLITAMAETSQKLTAFADAWKRAEIGYAADVMRDCPRETDNRLVDWLRTPG